MLLKVSLCVCVYWSCALKDHWVISRSCMMIFIKILHGLIQWNTNSTISQVMIVKKLVFHHWHEDKNYFSLSGFVFCILPFNPVEQKKKSETSLSCQTWNNFLRHLPLFYWAPLGSWVKQPCLMWMAGGWSFSRCCCVLLRWHTAFTFVFICFANNAYLGLSRMARMQCVNNDIPQALSGTGHITHHWQLSKSSQACRGTRLATARVEPWHALCIC